MSTELRVTDPKSQSGIVFVYYSICFGQMNGQLNYDSKSPPLVKKLDFYNASLANITNAAMFFQSHHLPH